MFAKCQNIVLPLLTFVKGLRAVRNVLALVREFESASGLEIHWTKSKFIPSRNMNARERRILNEIWEGAAVVDRTVWLGAPIGWGVTDDDVVERGISRVGERLVTFRKASMSWTMRVLAINMFFYSVRYF